MAEGDGAAERVIRAGSRARDRAYHRQRLGREGLVELDPVQLLAPDARLRQRSGDRRHRADAALISWRAPRHRVAAKARQRGVRVELFGGSSPRPAAPPAPSTSGKLPAVTVPRAWKTGRSRARFSTERPGVRPSSVKALRSPLATSSGRADARCRAVAISPLNARRSPRRPCGGIRFGKGVLRLPADLCHCYGDLLSGQAHAERQCRAARRRRTPPGLTTTLLPIDVGHHGHRLGARGDHHLALPRAGSGWRHPPPPATPTEQKRLIVMPGTVLGRPGQQHADAPTFMPCSASGIAQPTIRRRSGLGPDPGACAITLFSTWAKAGRPARCGTCPCAWRPACGSRRRCRRPESVLHCVVHRLSYAGFAGFEHVLDAGLGFKGFQEFDERPALHRQQTRLVDQAAAIHLATAQGATRRGAGDAVIVRGIMPPSRILTSVISIEAMPPRRPGQHARARRHRRHMAGIQPAARAHEDRHQQLVRGGTGSCRPPERSPARPPRGLFAGLVAMAMKVPSVCRTPRRRGRLESASAPRLKRQLLQPPRRDQADAHPTRPGWLSSASTRLRACIANSQPPPSAAAPARPPPPAPAEKRSPSPLLEAATACVGLHQNRRPHRRRGSGLGPDGGRRPRARSRAGRPGSRRRGTGLPPPIHHLVADGVHLRP